MTDAARERIEQELAQAREQRRTLAAQLGGEDPDNPDTGDRGDDANELEGLDDLARMDRRIDELERLLADPAALETPAETPAGLADGTTVTLRFPDGDEATYRVVAIPEQAPAEDRDDVLTASSPLGQALAGRGAGDTITYAGPDGELSAEVVALQAP
jgi:transcription elongation GreA/GreB family factor